jgi:hypothetical protein
MRKKLSELRLENDALRAERDDLKQAVRDVLEDGQRQTKFEQEQAKLNEQPAPWHTLDRFPPVTCDCAGIPEDSPEIPIDAHAPNCALRLDRDAVVKGLKLAMNDMSREADALLARALKAEAERDKWLDKFNKSEQFQTRVQDKINEIGPPMVAASNAIREELDELRAWRINVTSALRREGGALYADVPEHVRELRRKMDRVTTLCQAVSIVIEGFDKGIFVRDVTGDTDTWWAVRVLPYVSALATMKELVEI